MTPAANPQRYKHYRFPPEIISHAVWLYYRFALSYLDVEEMMFARGIGVTYSSTNLFVKGYISSPNG
jgi:putative transposase